MAAYRVRAVVRLEIEKVGIIDDAGNQFAHVVGLSIVDRHDAGELVRRITRSLKSLCCRTAGCWFHGSFAMISRAMRMPSASSSARYSPRPETVACISAPPSSSSVAISPVAARSNGGPRETLWRARARGSHNPTGRANRRRLRSMNRARGDLGNAGSGHARLIGEGAAALDEHLRLIDQVGAAGLDQPHERKFVSSAICWTRSCFLTPIGVEVPPLIALSLAVTTHRMPET